MKKVFKTGFFYLIAFSMVLGNSVLSIDFSIPVAHAEDLGTPDKVITESYPVPVVDADFNPAPTSVTITWDEIFDGRLDGYKVVFSETNPTPAYPVDGYIRWETDSTVTSFDYPYNYICDTNYYFSVTGYYDGGSHLEPGNGVTVNFACEEKTYCGDGIYEPINEEQCDNGIANIDGQEPVYDPVEGQGDRTYCSTSCQLYDVPGEYCGDEDINGPEECDDGSKGSDLCTTECTIIEEECSVEDNLLINGSFEEPEVTNTSLWQKMGSVLGWIIEKVSDDSATTLELHKGWSGNIAAEGLQYSELDGDHSTSVRQSASTEVGAEYKLFWSFAGRHNIAAEQNQLSVEVNGTQVATNGPTTGSAPLAQGDWTKSDYTFIADSTNTEVAFEDIGLPNDSLGTYVDDIRLCKIADPVSYCGDYTTDDGEECDDGPNGSEACTNECTLVYSPYCGDGEVNQKWEQCEPGEEKGCTEQCQWEDPVECSDLTLARVNIDEYDNQNAGDMSSDIYLGSSSYNIPSYAWFPVYWNGDYFLDADMNSSLDPYEDVSGLAVQRLEDRVRVVMHTSLSSSDYEEVDGVVEFYNASATGYASDNSGNNKLESPDYVNVHDGVADFYMWANVADDGFYTNWEIIEDCDDPEYSPYCGDGEVNQKWEQCEPGEEKGCTEQCQWEDPVECSDLTLARINVDDVQNWGNGNMTSDLLLGSSSYRIPSNVWFPIYWNGNYFLDSDIESYEDVDGLAVERLENSLRTVMYGTGTGDDKEHVSGNIEFYNATLGTQVSDNSNDTPGNNRLENGFDGTGVGVYNAGNDEVWVDEGKSFYWLTTTTADDGYYTTWDIIEDCTTSICGVKFNDKNQDLQQGEVEENLADWTINLYEKYSCSKGDEWADEVVSYNPGPNVALERSDASKALGVAENNDTMNFVSLGVNGELVLKFDNLIENGAGDDIQVIETSWGNPSCDAYPEYVHVYASQYGNEWTDLGDAKCQEGDPSFDLGSLPWAKYVKLVDENSTTGDGFDVDGVRAINCLNVSSEAIDTEVTTENGYCFEDLEAGYYMVCEEMQDAWINSTPLCQQVLIDEGDSVTVDFGNYTETTEAYCGDSHVDENLGETCDNDEPISCTTENGYDGIQNCNMPSDDVAPLQSIEITYCVWNECVSYDYCGDEIVNGLEQCDGSEGCTEECLLEETPDPICGDFNVDEGEQCDEGLEGSDSCTTQCLFVEEPPCIENCGGGGGGGTTFAIRDVEPAVSCEASNLSWRTTKSSSTILDYGTESGVYTESIDNATNTLNHSVQLPSLLPNTTYYYQITAIANSNHLKIVLGEKSFTTPPAEQCGEVLGEKITPLICEFLRVSGSSGADGDIDGVFQYPNGSLLRDACDHGEGVFLLKDQMKWHVPNWQYLHDHYFGQRIYNVLPTVLEAYPDWTGEVLGIKEYADGTLLRGSDMKIYILENGHKRHITTFEELAKYIGQEIIDVSDEVLDRY